MIPPTSHVSLLLNLIIHTYHWDATTVCILWDEEYPLSFDQLEFPNYVAFISLFKNEFLPEEDIPADRLDLLTSFESQLTQSIEKSYCESFVAFEKAIPAFVKSFLRCVYHSIWRSENYRFIFVYTEGQLNETGDLGSVFFRDLPDILLMEIVNNTLFNLKSNKFVGSRKDRPEEIVLVDRYNAELGEFEFNNNLYPDKTKDLQGRELISVIFPYEPFSILRPYGNLNVENIGPESIQPARRLMYDGTDAQIVIHFCLVYNCTLKAFAIAEDNWGLFYENYTFDGALQQLYTRDGDVAMMAMYMWYSNYLHLDMSQVLSRSGVTCLVPAPRRIVSWLLPLDPFQWLLWLAIVGCLSLETLGLLITYWADKTENATFKKSLCFGCLTSLKLFVSQGSDYIPGSLSVRTVLFSCYMIDIIITSIYSGGLASILTIPRLEEAADTLERLVKHKLFWSGTAPNWILTINNSDEELIKRVVKNFHIVSSNVLQQNKKMARSIGHVTERLTYGHFALPDYLNKELVDELKVMLDDIYYQYCVAFFSRPAPLIKKFNSVLLNMHSSGLTQFLEWKVVADHLDTKLQDQIEASAKPNFEDLGPVKLGMENFAGIIIVLILGNIISIIVFIGELFFYYIYQNDKMPCFPRRTISPASNHHLD